MHPEDGTMSGYDATDRLGEEPEGYSQEEQLKVLHEEGEHDHVYFDTSETEEEEVLREQFGPHDEQGIYHAPDEQGIHDEGGEKS